MKTATTNDNSLPMVPIVTTETSMRWLNPTTQKVSSKTAAVRLARELGFRVLTAGGLVEQVQLTTRDDEPEAWAWGVTVHPE